MKSTTKRAPATYAPATCLATLFAKSQHGFAEQKRPGHGLFLPICIGVAGPTNTRTRATPPWKHVSPSMFEQNSCQSFLFFYQTWTYTSVEQRSVGRMLSINFCHTLAINFPKGSLLLYLRSILRAVGSRTLCEKLEGYCGLMFS